jgi:phosphomannomutase
MTDPIALASEWLDGDPDPYTRAELRGLIEERNLAELAERMNGALAFGTAGLRGRVEAGSNRMNRAVVIRTTRGLADYLLDRHGGASTRPVVVGRDARLSSPQFMEDTIAVLTAAGLRVRYWEGETPTPVVAYAGRVLDAIASIVITASHNPPHDNGYKVYDDNGAQIVPPVDSGIAAAIDRVGPARGVPRAELPTDLATPIDREIFQAYLSDVEGVRASRTGDRSLRIVYTPMHGVGWQSVRAALRNAGYEDLHPVPEQVEPDGTFPTVSFPNPEEPGALDLSLELASSRNADLVLANDPDADRLAVAVPTESGWRPLTGNQIGLLLAEHILTNYRGVERPIVINSIVSSPMLADIAERHGARFETTLTGFKWISNAAMDLEASRVGVFVFGFEEALGYTVGPIVRDKDGISAAVVFADLMASARMSGKTSEDLLENLAHHYGLWVSTQKSVVRPGSSGLNEIAAAMDRLAIDIPDVLAGRRVLNHVDYRRGAAGRPRWLPASALVVLNLDGGTRLLVRPSGTEPKLKIYVDAKAARDTSVGLFQQDSDLTQEAQALAGAMVRFLDLEG